VQNAIDAAEGADEGECLWLDDLRSPPPGWVWVKSAWDAIDMIADGNVAVCSLDHDLGDRVEVGEGYDVILWIEEAIVERDFTAVPKIVVHSSNGPAKKRMIAGIENIERLKKPKIEEKVVCNLNSCQRPQGHIIKEKKRKIPDFG
jgi:hypothetical protein